MKGIVAAAVVLLVVTVVLAYGYWFGVTHGSLYITVLDVSDREHTRDVKPVQLVFEDATGRVLARAAESEKSGAIFVTSPSEYDCYEIEQRATFSLDAREEWSKCFERQSRWLRTWVREAKSVDLISNSCTIQRMPVSLSEHPDTWWLWWVPLRHIGGKPYTSFSFFIKINGNTCTLAV